MKYLVVLLLLTGIVTAQPTADRVTEAEFDQPPVVQKQICQTWISSQSKVVKQPETIPEQEVIPQPEAALEPEVDPEQEYVPEAEEPVAPSQEPPMSSDLYVGFGGLEAGDMPTDPLNNPAPEGIYDMGAGNDADSDSTCMLVYEPLCAEASDGTTVTFDNTCEMESAQKKDTIAYEVLHNGACSGDAS